MPSLVSRWLCVMPGSSKVLLFSLSLGGCVSLQWSIDLVAGGASDNSSLFKLLLAEFEVSSFFSRIETFQLPRCFRN